MVLPPAHIQHCDSMYSNGKLRWILRVCVGLSDEKTQYHMDLATPCLSQKRARLMPNQAVLQVLATETS